jgi:prepilin-type N-terminal cleavage/methylation domain-containing protein
MTPTPTLITYPVVKTNNLRAFTLIELLTVIAIIGILAAILIPVVGKVRAKARQSQGISNIRQVGIGLLTYSSTNGRLPGRFDYGAGGSGRGWSSILGDFLGRSTNGRHGAFFYDPLAVLPTATEFDGTHFSASMQLMPDRDTSGRVETYGSQQLKYFPLNRLRTPSIVFLLADGGQLPGTGVTTGQFAGTASATVWNSQTSNGKAPVPITGEGDTNSGAQALRYRASDGNALKACYADGHVAIVKKGNVLYENIDARFSN